MILCSCGKVSADLKVLEGNDAYGRGDPDAAIAAYLDAEAEPEASPWIRYNIASAYLAKGAAQAALEMLSSIDTRSDRELSFLVKYNEGCAELSLEHWDRAWSAFKDALLIDPSDIGAKRNAEYADERRKDVSGSSTSAFGSVDIDSDPAISGARRLIRRTEEARWRSLSEEARSHESDDY
jgi:tetratricopeptide (TPR) repeat protein